MSHVATKISEPRINLSPGFSFFFLGLACDHTPKMCAAKIAARPRWMADRASKLTSVFPVSRRDCFSHSHCDEVSQRRNQHIDDLKGTTRMGDVGDSIPRDLASTRNLGSCLLSLNANLCYGVMRSRAQVPWLTFSHGQPESRLHSMHAAICVAIFLVTFS